jgi:CBS domain-containing protein
VATGTRLRDAVAVLESRRLSELPVVDANGRPVGLLDIVDLVGLVPAEPAAVITGDTTGDAVPLPGTAAA